MVKGLRCIVTGGAGFIGSHLVDRLIALGADVTAFDNLSTGFRSNVNPRSTFCQGDVTILDDLLQAMTPVPDIVLHLAADARTKETQLGWNEPQSNALTNIIGTVNVLQAAVSKKPFPKVVFASSAAVYGPPQTVPTDESHPLHPISPYGVSKVAGEKYCQAYCQEYSLNVTIARLFNVYGCRQRRYVMYDLLQKLHADPSSLEVLGDGQQVREYCYVSDAVEAFILLALKGPKGGVFNISGGSPISIQQLVEKLLDAEGLAGTTNVTYTDSSWRGDIHRFEADMKAVIRLGFSPQIRLEEGINHLSQWVTELHGPE